MSDLSDLIEGCTILKKYAKDQTTCAAHDIMYFAPGLEEGDITDPEDAKKLKKLGFFYDNSVDSWARFT